MDVQTLTERVRAGDKRALARALTLVETRSPQARELVSALFGDERDAKLVGLTGPPGVGKSTLADALANVARERGKRVGVLAIDPTSPFSGGALLGDRARMDRAADDPQIFVRSMATRGHVGGLAGAAFEAIVLLQSAGKDFILVETVGTGQDEIEVAAAVDTTVVVLAPGLGDAVQASKAGLMEVADIIVVNKADRDGAELVAQDLHATLEEIPVVQTIARDGTGVVELYEAVEASRGARRLLESWLDNVVNERLRERISKAVWQDAVSRMKERKLSPYEAADSILESLKS